MREQEPQVDSKREYWDGFLVSIIWNGIAGLVFAYELLNYPANALGMWGAVWFAMNILIMIYLYWRHKRVFQGMLAGYGLGFLGVAIAGIFYGGICYGILRGL